MSNQSRTRRTISPETRAEVLKDYIARVPVKQIAEKHGVSKPYVSSLATMNGLRRYGKNRR